MQKNIDELTTSITTKDNVIEGQDRAIAEKDNAIEALRIKKEELLTIREELRAKP